MISKPLLALFAILLGSWAAADEMKLEYTNPLWDGGLADPFVFKDGDAYYAIGTGKVGGGRQFPMLKSTNFVDWQFVGGALDPVGEPALKEYWAPEIVQSGGKYYLYYAGDMKMRVAVADQPTGPFKDSGKLMFPDLPFSIDGHAFRDPQSAKWYFFFAMDFFDQRPGTALSVVQLGDDMITPQGQPQPVLRAFADWQIYQRNRKLYDKTWDAWHTIEGPAVVFRDGKYHLFYSGGNWQTPGYGVGCATSASITGPYIDENSKEGASVVHSIPEKLIGPGHNSVVLGPDNKTWFNFYHSWNDQRTKRQICMDPIEWTDKGPVTVNSARGKKTVTLK